MLQNRRNYYRVLQVQPEASHEVIKASWRAIMHAGRAHPDLGGDTATAALLNEAWSVLGDPVRRTAYDRELDLKRLRGNAYGPGPASGPRPAARRVDPSHWRTDRCCPMCHAPLPGTLRVDSRCARCDAPLGAVPETAASERELFGRRAGVRRPRTDAVALMSDWRGVAIDARMVDLSVGGAQLVSAAAVSPGTAVRVVTASLDAVARVVACHRSPSHWRARVQWLTVRPLTSKGVYLRASA